MTAPQHDPLPAGQVAMNAGDGGVRADWVLTSPGRRAAAVLAAVLAVLAVAIGVAALHAQPRLRVRTVLGPSPRTPESTDGTGCPVGVPCAVRASEPGALRAAFRQAFPSGQVLSGETTVNERTGRVVHAVMVAQLGAQNSLLVQAQCVPGAGAAAQRLDRADYTHRALNGDVVVDVRQLTVLVPGVTGCSVSLTLDLYDGAAATETATLRLAGDPRAQLPR